MLVNKESVCYKLGSALSKVTQRTSVQDRKGGYFTTVVTVSLTEVTFQRFKGHEGIVERTSGASSFQTGKSPVH